MTATQQHSDILPLSNGVFVTPQQELSISAWNTLRHSSMRNEGSKNTISKKFYCLSVSGHNQAVQKVKFKVSLSDEYIILRFINGTLLKLKNHFNLSAQLLNISVFASRSFSIGNEGVKNE